MKKIAVMLALLLLAATVLSACTNNNTPSSTPTPSASTPATSSPAPAASTSAATPSPEPVVETDEQRWFGAYDETVTVKVAIPTNAANVYPPGDSNSENVWTRALLEELNIKVDTMWEATDVGTGGDYETKLNLAIASDDLPDIIRFKNYDQFEKLVKAGKLEDLTDYYEDYAYPLLKQNMTASDNGEALSWGVYDGKQMGIPQESINYQAARMMWIRVDWLEESGLGEPKTIEDVIALAKAFKDADPANRIGMPFFKTVLEDGFCDITAMANAYGAYPRNWVEDKNGELVYGTLQPGMKKALEVYADLFAGGYIDPAFASLDGGKIAEQATNNQIGIFLGSSWLGGWPLNTLWETDKVDWNVYPLVGSATLTEPVKCQTAEPSGRLVAVKKGYEHPELLLKWLNFNVRKTADTETAEMLKFHSDPAKPEYGFHMYNPLYVYWGDRMTNFNTQTNVTLAIDNNDTSYLKTPRYG